MKKYSLFAYVFILALSGITMPAYAYNESEKAPKEPPPATGAKRIIPMGNFEALGSYSDITNGKGLWGCDISGYFSPVVRLNEDNYLIPLYNGSYQRMRQYVSEEEGNLLYNTSQIHNGSLALRTNLNDKLTSRVTALATWSFLKETKDESFGKGLYDYQDLGGSWDMRYNISDIADKGKLNCIGGLEYFHRKYPNYQSLISLAAQTAPETHEKDFNAIKFSTGLERKAIEGLSWEFKPSLMLKYFTDKKLIHDDGVLDADKKRRDYVASAALNAAYPFAEGRWEIAVDNTLDYNHSNLDFYDTRNTASLSDDIFTRNYYTYSSITTYPSLTYYYALSRDKKLSIKGGYSFLYRDYTGRKAQQSDGAYTDKKQKDTEHAFHLAISYPLTKSIAWVSTYDYTIAKSNQKYEKYYRYEYDVYQLQSGISVSF